MSLTIAVVACYCPALAAAGSAFSFVAGFAVGRWTRRHGP